MTNTLALGTKVYYTGDAANIGGWGVIVSERPATNYGPRSWDIAVDIGNETPNIHVGITDAMFENQVGRRFWIAEEWKAKQAAAMDEIRREYEALMARRAAARA